MRAPRYDLQFVGFFGRLIEIPNELVTDDHLRSNFIIDDHCETSTARQRNRIPEYWEDPLEPGVFIRWT